jgi:hypothetical protein
MAQCVLILYVHMLICRIFATQVLEFIQRCTGAAHTFNHSAHTRVQRCLTEIDAMRDMLNRQEVA